MNQLTQIFLFLLILHISVGRTLKAMLYCYLPSVDKTNPLIEYQNLVTKVNKILQDRNITVEVSICDPNGNGGNLYDPSSINNFFKDYDIIEIDVMYLSAITVPLMKFYPSQISYYDDVFQFEWDAVAREDESGRYLIGSPGLLCSHFIETRTGDYKQRLYAKYQSSYNLVSLYTNFYLNQRPKRTLDDMNYKTIDKKALNSVANFLKECQQNSTSFAYDQCWCLQKQKQLFLNTSYATTVGYSENLFNFFVDAGLGQTEIDISHVMHNESKRLMYSDQFIAKQSDNDEDRQTILQFYEAMLSKQIIDLYVRGEYTKAENQFTYLLPPTKSYFKQIQKEDQLYNRIYKSLFKRGASHYTIYQEQYRTNLENMFNMIKQSLKGINSGKGKKNKSKGQKSSSTQL